MPTWKNPARLRGAVKRQNSEASALVVVRAAAGSLGPAQERDHPDDGQRKSDGERAAPRERNRCRAEAEEDDRELEAHLEAGADELVQHHGRPHRAEPSRCGEDDGEGGGGRKQGPENSQVRNEQPGGRLPREDVRERRREGPDDGAEHDGDAEHGPEADGDRPPQISLSA